MPAQRVDLFQPLLADKPGACPIALRVGVPNQNSISEGVPSGGQFRVENYVLLSALPEELRRRVELAVQLLISQR
jgi:hypothetical protein